MKAIELLLYIVVILASVASSIDAIRTIIKGGGKGTQNGKRHKI